MTVDERSLLLLLARMVMTPTEFMSPEQLALCQAVARIEAAEANAADQERELGRG